MADFVGLLPAFVFVVTVGISTPVALAAHVLHRGGAKPFTRVLQVTLIEAGLLYLLGVYVVWSISDGIVGLTLASSWGRATEDPHSD